MSYGGGFSDSSSSTVKVDSSVAGKIIGRGGCRIKELQQISHARIQVSRDTDKYGQKSIEISGSDEEIEKARRMIEDILNSDFTDRQHGGFRNIDGRDGGSFGRRGESRSWGQRDRDGGDGREHSEDYARGGRGGSGRGGHSEGDVSETIYVESSLVGRIIGKGGCRIRDLEADSGCKIQISRDGSSQGRQSLELSGSKNAISEAKRLILDSGVEILNGDNCSRGGFDQNRSCSLSGSSAATNGVNKTDEEAVPEVQKRPVIDWGALRDMQEAYDKERFADLPEVIKDFYKEDSFIANMSPEEVRQIREENNNIIVQGPDGEPDSVPNPVKTFEDAFKHYPLILEQIRKQNFVKPSPIQTQAWPILLKGKDLIGIAQTGTGKTLAFLLPALIHIDSQPLPRENRNGPSALVLSPTRELAQQIEMEVNKINYKGIRSICVFGGGNRKEQLQKVKKGVEIVVATPGRLNDFMMNKIIDVKHVTYLVMDEADRMLDLGFELEIKKIMLDIRPDRQTVMTSATWPPEVQKLADQYMTNPYKVFVGTLDLAAVHSVKQCVVFVEEWEKKTKLLEYISKMEDDDKLMVFVGKKIIADDLSSDLAMSGIMCQCIHGDREQCDRETALEEFKDSTVHILIATDVASRGLDVKDITHVLNYDFPRHIEEYVHRIGRTGRAGRSGVSVTFVTRNDWKNAQQLVNIMSEADQEIPDELVAMAERYSAFRLRKDEEAMVPGFGGRGRGRGQGGRGGRRNHDSSGGGWI